MKYQISQILLGFFLFSSHVGGTHHSTHPEAKHKSHLRGGTSDGYAAIFWQQGKASRAFPTSSEWECHDRQFVPETCTAIYEVLKEKYLKTQWKSGS
ncbi:hypothetical protein F7725_001706 [Dissostichus mawsoni]|uniref:Uncharacterized protein n=1 Tax=Dissostichus mawsoni TaxID=36200 RepID=A0A7J5Y2F4_DISMA|nr:hypothetical protein F7725_001706 [Dissostichus mawsoni]